MTRNSPAGTEQFRGRRAAVVGLGLSNQAVLRFLLDGGADVHAFDRKTPAQLQEVTERFPAVQFHLGENYLADLTPDFDDLFLTPGMRKDLSEIRAAREAGARLMSEIGLVFDLCPAPIVGITGSAGKTTTTTLVGQLLEATGRRVHVGGNIGRPLLGSIEEITADDIVVLELSSFQLEMLERSPQVAVLLNLRPNHLDIHPSMAAYAEAKQRIYRFQAADDVAVFNAGDRLSASFRREAPGRVWTFLQEGEVTRGAYSKEGVLWLADEGLHRVMERAEIPLLGEHNVENVLAALCVGRLFGLEAERMAEVVRRFRPVDHRLELVGEHRGVRYYNDSIATAPDRTLAALASFTAPLVLIAGGYDKHLAYHELGEAIVGRVKRLILLGQTADAIQQAVERAIERAAGQASEQAVDGAADWAGQAVDRAVERWQPGRAPEVIRVRNLDEAVAAAAAGAEPGDMVLLSPASASYDMFRDYKERGEVFRRLVRDLS